MQSKNRDLQPPPPPPTIHFVFSSSRTLPLPCPAPLSLTCITAFHAALLLFLLFFLCCTVPSVFRRLQRIIIQGDTAPRLPLIVSRSHHVAREGRPPQQHVLAAIELAEVRERRREVLSLFARASRKHEAKEEEQGRGETESATIYEWSPRW